MRNIFYNVFIENALRKAREKIENLNTQTKVFFYIPIDI